MNNMTKGQNEQDYKIKEAYADANLFIYAAVDEGEIGKKARGILEKVKNGEYKIYTSTLTIDEFLWRVKKEAGRKLAGESVNIFFTLLNLELIDVNVEIISSAINFYKSHKLDPRDAIHLACMFSKKLNVMLSSDSDFDKIYEIKRIDFSK